MGRIKVELASGRVLDEGRPVPERYLERAVGNSCLRVTYGSATDRPGRKQALSRSAYRSMVLFAERSSESSTDPNSALSSTDSLAIVFDEDRRRLVVTLPLVGTTPLFYSTSAGSLVLTDDLRELYHSDFDLDERGVYSLLQFGSIAAPFSIWRQAHRLAPGYTYVVDTGSFEITRQAHDFWKTSDRAVDSAQEPAPKDPDKLLQTLDAQLQVLCPDGRPVILFSGGVDSGLLAARARPLGWQDALLVHYSFDANDPESELAREMARHLGLQFVTVEDSDQTTASMLENIGATYFFPFGDHSSLPTYKLIRAAAELADGRRYVLDGTGADGAFGMYAKTAAWRKIYSLPKFAREWAGFFYATAGTWRREGKLEAALKVIRRSSQMPLLLSGVLAQNAHTGILQHPSPQVVSEVHGSLSSWVEESMGSLSLDQRYGALDITNVCCDIFAQKNRSFFASSPFQVGYPFLGADIVRLALTEGYFWSRHEETKAILKELLCRFVPSSMVYRKKSGFLVTMEEQFASDAFQDTFYGVVLSEKNPLLNYLDQKKLSLAFDGARNRIRLPFQLYNLMWNVLFTSLWLEQTSQKQENMLCVTKQDSNLNIGLTHVRL